MVYLEGTFLWEPARVDWLKFTVVFRKPFPWTGSLEHKGYLLWGKWQVAIYGSDFRGRDRKQWNRWRWKVPSCGNRWR